MLPQPPADGNLKVFSDEIIGLKRVGQFPLFIITPMSVHDHGPQRIHVMPWVSDMVINGRTFQLQIAEIERKAFSTSSVRGLPGATRSKVSPREQQAFVVWGYPRQFADDQATSRGLRPQYHPLVMMTGPWSLRDMVEVHLRALEHYLYQPVALITF